MGKDFFIRHAKKMRILSICACAAILLVASAVVIRPELFAQKSVDVDSNTVLGAQPTSEPVDPMDEFISERDQLRAMQVAQLNEIIYGEKTDEETKKLAQRQLMTLMDWQEKETTVEGILRMRGYEDAICTVHDDSVNIVIRAESINKQESAVVYELVLRETGVTGGNVKIVPIN